MEQKILLSLHRKGLHPGQGETPDFSPCRSLSLYADHSPCMQLIDYLPLHAEWGVVDWAPLILLRGTEGNKSSLETCANFRAKNYTPCFLGWREYNFFSVILLMCMETKSIKKLISNSTHLVLLISVVTLS